MEKPQDTYIFLVRHGESEGNVDRKKHSEKADWQIELTQKGKLQARGAGEFLQAYLSQPEFAGKKKCLWQSSYQRTRQTAEGILQSIRPMMDKVYESDRLREQSSGLWDGLNDEERAAQTPDLWKHHQKNTGDDERGKYFAQNPCGESSAEVGDRVALFQHSLMRDVQEGTPVHVIVSHGLTTRIFVKEFFHHPFEWLANERNPRNCSIRLIKGNKIDGYKDLGYIYTGKKEELAAIKAKSGQGIR